MEVYLADKFESHELRLLYKSYDVVGEIAIIRVPESLKSKSKIIAEAILQTQKHVKTVLSQTSPVSGNFRLRNLEWIAGEKQTESVYKEYGCSFKVDLEKCYFSPRLSYERMRIAKQVKRGEVVVNMFAGVGCYSILIAKYAQASKTFSVDINPTAVQYMLENIRLNKLQDHVVAIHGDSKDVIQNTLRNTAHRVLMPLPERAYEYLNYALLALKSGGWIHYYDFEHQNHLDPLEKVKVKVSKKLEDLSVNFEIRSGRVVRTIGPNWSQIVLDIIIFN